MKATEQYIFPVLLFLFLQFWPTCSEPLFQSEAKNEDIDIKMIFNSRANKPHFHKKRFALSRFVVYAVFVLKVAYSAYCKVILIFLFFYTEKKQTNKQTNKKTLIFNSKLCVHKLCHWWISCSNFQLEDTRTTDRKQTFLSYVVGIVQKKFPDLQDFAEELYLDGATTGEDHSEFVLSLRKKVYF